MKNFKLIFSYVLIFITLTSSARVTKFSQEKAPDNFVNIFKDTTKLNQVPAQFPGGNAKWIEFVNTNLDDDVPVRNDAPVGKYEVIASFVIDREGEVKDIKIEQNPGYGMAEEVLRLFSKCPRWIPASQNGKNVIYRHRQHFAFQVSQD